MKKSILNIGKILTKAEQKQINGGSICSMTGVQCFSSGSCNSENCSGSHHYCECNACIDTTVELDEDLLNC